MIFKSIKKMLSVISHDQEANNFFALDFIFDNNLCFPLQNETWCIWYVAPKNHQNEVLAILSCCIL
jgi:hypothetical protein